MPQSRSTASATLLPLAAFLAVGTLLLPFYRYELSPDAISYLSISAEYIAGYWKEAVNAYWGPLYSWCIATFLALHVPGMLAAKLVALGAGALALFGLHSFSLRFDMTERCRRAFLWTGAAMILAFVMEVNSPDLLFTALLLLYLAIIFDPAYPSSRYSGLLCGVLGALAYFAKSYGFFFFAAHFPLFSAAHWIMQKDPSRRSRVVGQFFAGLAIFLAISSVWIVSLHGKYESWTLGTTGEFNHRLVGPESTGYPHFRHLLPPVGEHAITSWETPSLSWLPEWSALASRSNLVHQAKLIYENAKHLFQFWTYTTPLFAAFLLGYAVLCLDSANTRQEWIFPILTIALFSCGYLLITVEDRYFWLADLLLLWIAFRTIDLLLKRHLLALPARVLLVAGVVLSFLIGPVLTLHAHLFENRALYRWSEDIKRSDLSPGRLASCSDWQDSAYLAYVLGMPYYGVPSAVPEADQVTHALNPDYHPLSPATDGQDEIPGILSAAGIDYFVMWPSCAPIWPATNETVAKAGDIRLLRLDHGTGTSKR